MTEKLTVLVPAAAYVDHHKSCPRALFWDAGEWECPCKCPRGWPWRVRERGSQSLTAQGAGTKE